MKWFAICLLAVFSPGIIPGGEPQAYLPAVWGVEEGLPQHVVSAVVQTRNGDIWCGSFHGLARFDGVKFTVFDEHSNPGLPGRGVTALYEDRQGVLWVGSDTGGVSRIINRVPVPTPTLEHHGTGDVLSFGEDAAGDLWVLWEDGVLVRWRDQWQVNPTPDIALSEPELRLVQDGDGVLWLTHKYGFSEVSGKGLVPAAHGIPQEGWGLQRATAAADGGLWVIAESKLRRWKNGSWFSDLGRCPWDPPEGTDYLFVSVLRELKDGRLLAGTVDGGVAIGFPRQAFQRYTRQQGLPHDWIRCAMEDREGNLWLGTGGGGLAALRPQRVSMMAVEPDQGQHNVQSLLSARDGSFWVATEGGGLFRKPPGQTDPFVRQEPLPTRYIWSVTQDRQDRIWTGTWSAGLWMQKRDQAFAQAPRWPTENTRVTVLWAARDNTVWAGGPGILLRSTAVGWESKDPDGQALSPPGQRVITGDEKGDLWIGLNDGRLLHRHGGQRQFYDRTQGLPGDAVVSLMPGGPGVMWAGTAGGGLVRIKEGQVSRFTTAEGLPNNVISQILLPPGGFLWLGSYGGICRLSLTELEECAASRIQRLNPLVLRRSDGLSTLECTSGGSPGACSTPDGRLWFPTNNGIAIINPAAIRLNPLPPPVLMESLSVDARPVSLTGLPLVLGPGAGGVSIAYTALSFTSPERVRFRTRLAGLENTWQETGPERLVTYRYLPPGSYQFHVTACNNDGLWNGTGASLSFTILPYFWQTGWFLSLASLATMGVVGSLVGAAMRRRNHARLAGIERSHALERERARIARDIHDDLGSGLTRIMLLSQSARSEMLPDHPAAAELDNVCQAAEGLTRTMDEVVWAVDPRHDTLESLVGYIGSTAQELLQSARIRFRLEAPDQLPTSPVMADARHSFYLACKEALHNIIRHSQAKTARLIFQMEAQSLVLTIEDDGIGFDPALPPTRAGGGHGLANMQTRLAEAGGTCTLTTQPGSGTRIIFRLPCATSLK
jgi:signal transduction histidine kinase/ligand-binding sensor domain-containing protein